MPRYKKHFFIIIFFKRWVAVIQTFDEAEHLASWNENNKGDDGCDHEDIHHAYSSSAYWSVVLLIHLQ